MIKREPYVISVCEADFYTIYYALKSLLGRVNANKDEVERIIIKLDEIIDERQSNLEVI